MTDHDVEEVIKTIDDDGSGEVCFGEFSAWVASGHYESEDIEEVVDGLFSMIDIDGDGFLTHAEFKTALQSHAKDLTDSDISALINECDEDQDGQIIRRNFRICSRFVSKLLICLCVLLLLLCVCERFRRRESECVDRGESDVFMVVDL